MLPVITLVAVAIPVLVIAFLVGQKKRAEVEQANAPDRAELEREFAAAERYQEKWREEQREHPGDESLY
ncbi:MAG TPA: hypothetical protein VH721_01125 [Gaiellaceae bacterium]|jgi:hypothetical protein